MSIRQWFCSHSVYIDEMHRFNDELVVAVCHKCEKVLAATYGLALSARLNGYRPKPCETCKGTGVKT